MLLILLISLFSGTKLVHSESNDGNDFNFENFTHALNQISIQQNDFFDWMETVTEYIGIFDDHAGKASGLLVKAMKNIFSVDSPEEKALKDLTNIISSADRRTSAAISRALARQFFKTEQSGYRRDVSDKLGTSHKYISRLFKPNRTTTVFPEFQQLCSLQNQERPGFVLNVLNNILVEECKKESEEERKAEKANNMNMARTFFHDLDKHFEWKMVKNKDYNNVKDYIYTIASQSSGVKAAMMITDLKKVVYSEEFKVADIENKTIMMMEIMPPKVPGSCYLMSALDGHEFKHEETTQELVPVVYDVAFASFSSILCAYVIYDDNIEKINEEVGEIRIMTENIIENIPKFLTQAFEDSWKNGNIKETVIRAINDSILLMENYTAQAVEAQAKINLMGNPKYLHEIVIANNAFDGYHFKCNPIYCDTIKDHFNMVNIFISRFEKADYGRMELAAEWYTVKVQKQINDYFSSKGYRQPFDIANDLDILLNVSTIFRSLLVNQEWSFTPFLRHLNKQKTPDFDFRGLKQSQNYRGVIHFGYFYDNCVVWLL